MGSHRAVEWRKIDTLLSSKLEGIFQESQPSRSRSHRRHYCFRKGGRGMGVKFSLSLWQHDWAGREWWWWWWWHNCYSQERFPAGGINLWWHNFQIRTYRAMLNRIDGLRRRRKMWMCIEMEANIELSGTNPSVRSDKTKFSGSARLDPFFINARWDVERQNKEPHPSPTCFGLLGCLPQQSYNRPERSSNSKQHTGKGQILKQGNRI